MSISQHVILKHRTDWYGEETGFKWHPEIADPV